MLGTQRRTMELPVEDKELCLSSWRSSSYWTLNSAHGFKLTSPMSPEYILNSAWLWDPWSLFMAWTVPQSEMNGVAIRDSGKECRGVLLTIKMSFQSWLRSTEKDHVYQQTLSFSTPSHLWSRSVHQGNCTKWPWYPALVETSSVYCMPTTWWHRDGCFSQVQLRDWISAQMGHNN